MAAILLRSCTDIPVDKSNLVFYLRDKNCLVKSPSRPFHEIEKNLACAIVDLRKETMALPAALLMDTGYDVGCTDVAHIPLILLMDDSTIVPREWLMCKHVYRSNEGQIKDVVDIFIRSIKKFQENFNIAERSDIVARLELRQQLINTVNDSIGEVSRFINKKKEAL